jgi:hypothetical protein
MRRINILGTTIVAALVFSAIASSAAQATGPFYKVKMKGAAVEELKTNVTYKIKGKAVKPFTLVAGTTELKCTGLSLNAGAVLMGSKEKETAGSSKETITFTGCTVVGNGSKCGVEKEEIKTEELENWQAKANKTGVKGEKLFTGFKPAAGLVFVKVKFKPLEGGECTLKETAIETGKENLGVSGIDLNAAGNELKLEENETLGTTAFITFPATLQKVVFVEKEKNKIVEIKEKMTAFGKSVTKFEGEAEVENNEGAELEFGVFG